MAKNNSNLVLEERVIKSINDLRTEIRNLKSNQLRRFVVPHFSGEPPGVQDGEVWYDDNLSKFRKREGGSSKNWEGS